MAVETLAGRVGRRRAGRHRADDDLPGGPSRGRRDRVRPSPEEVGPYGRRAMPAGKALFVILIALLLGGLLNVGSLTEAAERQPPGLGRSASIVMVWPFQQVSRLLGLDQPSEMLSARLGRAEDAGTTGGGEDVAAASSAGADVDEVDGGGDALAVAAALAGREAIDTALGNATAIPADGEADPESAPPLSERLQGPFTEADPLSVMVIGDSLTEQVGPSMVARLARPGVPAEGRHDFTYSSGLSRPDFYDWPARARQLAAEFDPDIWVVMIGANDGQDVRDDSGAFRHMGSPEWEEIYRQRVGALMDVLTADGAAVVWVGQPIMRDPDFDETMAYVTSMYEAEAAERAFVSYVDARQVFADAQGRYADYLPAGDGQLSQMRMGDGIHLTRSGAERIVTQVMPLLPIDQP